MTVMVAASLVLGVNIAFAQNKAIDDLTKTFSGETKSNLTDFENRSHDKSAVDSGADTITSVIFYAIDFLKYLVGGIAVLFAIVSGIKLITAGTKIDEVSEKEKENLKYIIYGLILIIIADQLVTKVFFGDHGECMESASNAEACSKVGDSLVTGIYSFILAILATVAVFVIVIAAFRMITAFGNEETVGKEKKRIGLSVVGLIIAAVGEFAVKGIIFPKGGTKGIDVAKAQQLVYSFTNFVSSFIATGALLMLVYGGYMYVVSAGNDEQTGKAKKIIVSALIGIVIGLLAYAFTRTLITLSPGRPS